MSRLDVSYDGQKVGTLAEARGGVYFEYDSQFIATGHELSPLKFGARTGALSSMCSRATATHPGENLIRCVGVRI